MLKVNNNSNNELEIIYNNITLIKHSTEKPAFSLGKARIQWKCIVATSIYLIILQRDYP
ncbi:glycosidase domain protein [Francisella tularensis subsp. tularensis]|nr:glycosidase domain protein [Francisella tularensis subsp. tularensis]KFJ63878.1 hypothetical protein DR81_1640 [Francisella tularensis]